MKNAGRRVCRMKRQARCAWRRRFAPANSRSPRTYRAGQANAGNPSRGSFLPSSARGALCLLDEPLYFLTALVADLFVKRLTVLVLDRVPAFLPDGFEELGTVALFGGLSTLTADFFVKRRPVLGPHGIAASFAGLPHRHLAVRHTPTRLRHTAERSSLA